MDGNPAFELALVRQKLADEAHPDPAACVDQALAALPALPVKPGQTVALALGSRKIDQLGVIAGQVAKFLTGLGLKPFIVPAMGSHGGATPEGQTEVLDSLGALDHVRNIPVRAEMEAKTIGTLPNGFEIPLSSAALSADHIVVVNRVKPHTKFSGDIESGLCKMLAIGLGKIEGATRYHKAAVRFGFGLIKEAAAKVLTTAPILFGLGVVEDGYGRLSLAGAFTPEDLIPGEAALLEKAKAMMPRIPFQSLEVLVVDQMGKDISGIGMDSNVTGRHRDITGDFFLPPNPERVFVRDLTEKTAGNANGIGLADFTTTRLVNALDRKKTFVNAMTAISPEKAAIPMHFDTDREAVAACLATCGCQTPEAVRLVRIVSTSRLAAFYASRAMEPEILENPDLTLVTPWEAVAFDENGNLPEFPPM